MTRQLLLTRAAISCLALATLIAHLFVPVLKLDPVGLGLLVLIVIPWLTSVIKSLEIPGAGKIEFQEVQEATQRAAGDAYPLPGTPAEPEFSFSAVSEVDPNLALVGLRIELETRLRNLAKRHGIDSSRPVPQLINDLQSLKILTRAQAAGLRDLVALGNGAAHGVDVSKAAGGVARDSGPAVLRALDALLTQAHTA